MVPKGGDQGGKAGDECGSFGRSGDVGRVCGGGFVLVFWSGLLWFELFVVTRLEC